MLRWWNDHLGGPFPSAITQTLQTLRGDIYEFLEDEMGRIVKEPGQNSPVHLAPPGAGDEVPDDELPGRTILIDDRGAGFGDAETNRLVEAAAMRVAIEAYVGWEAVDVSKLNFGWDITFRRDSLEHHVEVKGVTGQRPRVLLTRNELAVAKDDNLWTLLVVTRALVAPQVHRFERQLVLAKADPYMFVADLT